MLRSYLLWAIFILVCFNCPAQSLRRVSVSTSTVPPSAGGNGDSCIPIISADGQFVLFASAANNLALDTNNAPIPTAFPPKLNVYLRNTTNASTVLLSFNVSGAAGNGDSVPAGICTNNRYVVFESTASDLVPNDTNKTSDVFVRDLLTSSTEIISVNTNGLPGNNTSRNATVSPDGRHVAFVSAASDLVANDTNGVADVFIRDLENEITTLVSVGAIWGLSEAPEISPDGRFVAFWSTAEEIIPGVRTDGEIYVRDVDSGITHWASSGARGLLASVYGTTNGFCSNHTISDDGRFVAFQICSNLASRGMVLRYDTDLQTTEVIHTNSYLPRAPYADVRTLDMTPDGRSVVFIANTNSGVTTNASVLVWSADSGITTVASGNLASGTPLGEWPAIDPTGRFVLFSSPPNLYLHDLQSNITSLVNADTNGVASPVSMAAVPTMSFNGRVVAFQAYDGNLVANDNNRKDDIFCRDIDAATTKLVSERHATLVSASPNGPSTGFSVSSNGRYVALLSSAENLVSNDTNGMRDVFVRDLLTGTNIMASIGTNGFSGNGVASDPVISGDGRFVAFTLPTPGSIPNSSKNNDVYVYSLESGVLSLQSVNTVGNFGGNSDSAAVSISHDGRYVLFRSKASNLTTNSMTIGTENVFVRDRETVRTVALTLGGMAAATMTADGRYVAFTGKIGGGTNLYVWDNFSQSYIYTNASSNLRGVAIAQDGTKVAFTVSTNLYVADLIANTNRLVAFLSLSNRFDVHFSGDGGFLTYSATDSQVTADTNGVQDVYVYDLVNNITTLVSRAFDTHEAANGLSERPTISYDGRFVAYRSFASNIVAGDDNGYPDLFIYDREKQATTLLSRGTSDIGNHFSSAACFSGDGRTLVFPSWASNLTSTDWNQDCDLFTLALLYVTVTKSTDMTTISWPIVPAQVFKVQYKDDVDQKDWIDLGGTIVIEGGMASIQDSSPGLARRFYRVLAN